MSTSTTNTKLITELRAIADRLRHGSKEEMAVASILFAVCGAIQSGQELRLMDHVAKFAYGEVKRLSAGRN